MSANERVQHTQGPWNVIGDAGHPSNARITAISRRHIAKVYALSLDADSICEANARLIAAAPELLEALRSARHAIGDHHAPGDCYSTGPVTGNFVIDHLSCPACSFLARYDAVMRRMEGR